MNWARRISHITLLFALSFGVFGHRTVAQQIERETARSAAAQNLFSEAVELQNRKQFDLAAEVWERFLLDHPQDRLIDQSRFYAGVCRMQMKEHAVAARHFKRLLETVDDFPQTEDAYLNLGWCQYALGRGGQAEQLAAAATSFTTLMRKFRDGQHVPQALFYLGETLYAQQRPEQAIASYRRLTEDFPQSPLFCEALYAMGVAYEEQQEYEAAGEVYGQFLNDCKASELVAEVTMRKAESLLQLDKPQAAENLFAAAARMPDFASADHALSRQALSVALQGDHARSAGLYASLVERFAESSYADEATLHAARAYYRAEQWQDATQWLQKALVLDAPRATEAAHWLCRLAIRQGEFAEALQLAELFAQRAKDLEYEVDLWLDRADALFDLSDRKNDALRAYEQIVSEFPQHPARPLALYYAAFAALDIGHARQALRTAETFFADHPEHRLSSDMKYVAAESQLIAGEVAAAEQIYAKLLAAQNDHPDRSQWTLRHGYVCFVGQNYDKALTILEPLAPTLKDADRLAEARYLLGVSQFHRHQYPEATKHLRGSLDAQAKGAFAFEALLYLARSQAEAGQLDKAASRLDQLIAAHPQDERLDQAFYRRGEVEYQRQNYDRSAEAYRTVTQRWPTSRLVPFAIYGQGLAALKAADHVISIAAFSRLLDQHPTHELASRAALGRGMSRRQIGKHGEAIADLNSYLEMAKQGTRRADALYERGLAEAAHEDFAAALKSFQTLLDQHDDYPQTVNVLYELAWAAKNNSDVTTVRESFSRLTQRFPDHPLAAEAHFHLGEDHYGQEAFVEAAKQFALAHQKADAAELAEQSLHKQAWSAYRCDDFQAAAELFRHQREKFPQGALGNDGRFMLAESQFQAGNFPAALSGFQEAQNALPSSAAMQVLVFLHGGQAAGQVGKWQDSLNLLNKAAKQFPDSSYLAEIVFERGRARQQLADRRKAIADYEQAAILSRGEVGARARFMIGEIQFEQKEYAAAVKSYRRVIFGFGSEQAKEATQQWQAMSAYEAARCSELQNRLAQAIVFYRHLLEHFPEHEFAPQASKRLSDLK
jgi:TolA-binding protein